MYLFELYEKLMIIWFGQECAMTQVARFQRALKPASIWKMEGINKKFCIQSKNIIEIQQKIKPYIFPKILLKIFMLHSTLAITICDISHIYN
jgi:hypothetical protein